MTAARHIKVAWFRDLIDDAKGALKAARHELALAEGDGDSEAISGARADVEAAELDLERLYDSEPDGEPDDLA